MDLSNLSTDDLLKMAGLGGTGTSGDRPPISVRNNNPGNLRDTQTGEFNNYQTPEDGIYGQKADLLKKISGSSAPMLAAYGEGYTPSLRNIISIYAPPSDNNDTESYINTVAKELGVDPEQALSPVDTDRLAAAMTKVEGGKSADQYFNTTPDYSKPVGQTAADVGLDVSQVAPKKTEQALEVIGAPMDMSQMSTEELMKLAGINQEKGFIDRVKDDFSERSKQANEINQLANNDQISELGAMAQLGGKVGYGMANDVVGEGINSAMSGINDLSGGVIGDYASKGIDYLANTGIGKAVSSGAGSALKAYGEFEQNNPNAGRYIDSAANTVGFGLNATGGAGALKSSGNALSKAGDAIYNSGAKSANVAKRSFLQDLITPKETPTVKADLFGRSKEEGLLRNRVVQPNSSEQQIVNTLSELPLSENNSLLKNYNTIKSTNQAEANNLIKNLEKNDFTVSDDSIINGLSNVRNELADNVYVSTQDGSKIAENIVNKATDIISKNDQTASGILKARKEFDNWITLHKDPKIFNPNVEGPASAAIQRVRQMMNNIVDETVPDLGVKESLRKQSNLYRAMDAIQTKGGSEGKNIISRTAKKVTDSIPGKGMAAKAATATVGAGLGIASPAVAGGALGAYGAYRALSSPIARKSVGGALRSLPASGITLSEGAAIPASALMNYKRNQK